MRDNKRKGINKKHCLRTMGILMASVMVLSVGTSQITFAGESNTKVETSDKTEEKLTVYLDGKSGSDSNSGDSPEEAVKTFSKASKLAGDYAVIRICGTVTVKGDETWELPSGVSVRRADDFEEALVKVQGSLTLENVRIYSDDITGDGEIEGAAEREKVYVPKRIVMKTPTALTELPLGRCDGDGVFSWEDESLVPTQYETVYKVIFHPYDTKAVDYTQEKGWNEENETVVREVTVQVTSLKPAEEDKTQEGGSENNPENTPESTPEVTPESTPQATPEAAPETKPETQPETPQVTPEGSPAETPDEGTVQQKPQEDQTQTPGTTETPGTEEGTQIPVQPTPDTQMPADQTPDAQPGTTTPQPGDTAGDGNSDLVNTPAENLSEEDKAAAAEVQNQVDYLPTEVESKEVVEAIVDASKSYEALSAAQKAYLPTDVYQKLAAAQNSAQIYNRKCNGVTIEGEFPWYIQFQVELKNDKEDTSVLEAKNVDTFISPYEMKLWNLMTDEEYKLNGQQVRVTMPAPDMQLYNQLVVVHYLEDGSVEYITPIHNGDGTISFVTTSFSPYNIAGSKVLVGNTDKLYSSTGTGSSLSGGSGLGSSSTGKTSSTGNSSKNTLSSSKTSGSTLKSVFSPNTGDSQNPVMYIIIAVASLAVLAIIVLLFAVRLNKKKK